MEITINSNEMIKPSSPTPPHLRSFKLSLLDQFVPTMYTPILLFFPAGNFSDDDHRQVRSRILKNSLSTFLTRYYPLAGRLNGNISVECNDEGVYYSEAEVDSSLLDVLREPEIETMKKLMPPKNKNDILFLVQVTFFECGGLSIGVCISHKFSDAASTTTVIRAWAAEAEAFMHHESILLVAPQLSSAAIFPPIDNLPMGKLADEFDKEKPRVVVRRYVFSASKIASLKEIAVSEEVRSPSRVEVVSAFLWRRTIRTIKLKLGTHRPLAIVWPVNLRARLLPPLGSDTFGNIAIPMVMEGQDESECEIKLSKLINVMRRGILEIDSKYGRELGTEELVGEIFKSYTEVGKILEKASEMDFHGHSSWCRFPLYEVDFGWGKPVWATIAYIEHPNTVVLMDARDDGAIEAWVSLKEEDMFIFEQDDDLSKFATLNPCPYV
ncbi:stemmadenine O-acetyltransferase-like [Impatiens glandulifera]|uniref:stemmadenine O-acetyltransferase-like n=1 Tax=Impatiens glandulifera TaxID=253017 RepID=UPI001FB17B69|nr:stemmadenine O-acetyltransferase-like [Impatiens glandulifera]